MTVRPGAFGETTQFNAEMDAHHWLGHGLTGQLVRYVAELDGRWVAVLGVRVGGAELRGAIRVYRLEPGAAVRLADPRSEQPAVLRAAGEPGAEPGVGGAGPGAAPAARRLPGRRRAPGAGGGDVHRPLAADRRLLCGGELRPGRGHARLRAQRRPLPPSRQHQAGVAAPAAPPRRPDPSAPFDHPLLAREETRVTGLNSLPLSGERASLLEVLGGLTDPRARRGIRHKLAATLTMVVAAGLSGCGRSFHSAGDFVADLPQEALARLGARWHPVQQRYIAPDEATIRRHVKMIDADEADRLAGWQAGWHYGGPRWQGAQGHLGEAPGCHREAGLRAGARRGRDHRPVQGPPGDH